ncbi:hypothetical protein [Desulfopila sp. IMCC35008]|uniref:hypothetical protein n=1 Tax=Desulfopila sp. IMCC35008 TaxID=2653858 RepID=UPI0013D29FE9|nr:hypothetical protein [Desulfopila sp. IMCC35008]
MLLIDYLKSGVISYTVEKKNFCVRYIYSDARFHQSGQKYALSWNGKQYCSENQHLKGVSKDWPADGAGFYTYDRH